MPPVDSRTRSYLGWVGGRPTRNILPWLPWAVAVGALAIAVLLGFALPDYPLYVATSVLVAMVSLMGLGIVTGTAGMIALCQLSFAAVGAWVFELIMTKTPFQEWLGGFAFIGAMLIGASAASILGFVVGLPALRLRGVNLAVVTLGVASAVDMTVQRVSFPGQWDNVYAARPFGMAGPTNLNGNQSYFLFTAIVVVIVGMAVFYMQRSRLGASWRSVAFSERGTASTGTSVTVSKLSAFIISAFIGGIGGALTIGQIGQANDTTFQTAYSLGMYVLAVAVGAQLLEMTLLGAILFVLVPEILKQFKVPLEWGSILFAVLGIQALTTNSNFGNDIRNMIARRRRRRHGASETESRLSALPSLDVPVPVPGPDVLLRVRGLTVEFGTVKALSGVDIDLREGEVLGLIGPNGAGKSTFIDALTGFLPHRTGTVHLGEIRLDNLAPHEVARAGLRRTFQQDRVPSTMTVGAYVDFVTRGQATKVRIDEVLEYFGTPGVRVPLLNVDVGTRRLIEVAAGIAAAPQVLLLDEPAAGLSHEEHVALAARLRGVPSTFGVTLLIIEHDLDLVRSVCSNIAVLDFGELLAHGDQQVVLADPRVLKAYMGEVEML